MEADDFTSEFGRDVIDRYFHFLKEEIVDENISPSELEEQIDETVATELFKPIHKSSIQTPDPVKSDSPFHVTDTSINKSTDISLTRVPDISQTMKEISPTSIVNYLRDNNVVGEEANGVLLTAAIADGMHVILEGPSGSGKTFLMDKILALYDGVYELGLQSAQALWREADGMNESSIIYMPELQKAVADNRSSGVIEFMKNLGEGKDAVRRITNQKKDGITEYRINAGRTLVSTIALENRFTYDKEMQRRFLILQTDSSEKHIEDIITDKVERQMEYDLRNDGIDSQENLREHIRTVIDSRDIYILNPFMHYLKQTIPVVNRSQSYLDKYLDIFNAWGKFFASGKERITVEENEFVLLEVEDIYHVYNTYHENFIRVVAPDETQGFIPDWSDCYKSGLHAAKTIMKITTSNRQYELRTEFPDAIQRWEERQVNENGIYVRQITDGSMKKIGDVND